MGFGPRGWGQLLLQATLMTIAVSVTAFALGSVLGALIAWARIEGNRLLQLAADAYTTVLRGVPDLLVIYLIRSARRAAGAACAARASCSCTGCARR